MPKEQVNRAPWRRLGASIRSAFSGGESYRAELERSNRELSSLVEATTQLTSELNRDRLLDKVLAAARHLLRADEAMLWLSEGNAGSAQLSATTFDRPKP